MSKSSIYTNLKKLATKLNRPYLPYVGSRVADLEAQLREYKTLKPLKKQTTPSSTLSKSTLYHKLNRLHIKYNVPILHTWRTSKSTLQKRLDDFKNLEAKRKTLLKFVKESQIKTVNYQVIVHTSTGTRPLEGSIRLNSGQSPIDVIADELEKRTSEYSMDLTETIMPEDIKYNITTSRVLTREQALRRVNRQPLKAVIYKIDNDQVSDYQDTENCMLNYIVEMANKRNNTYAEITRDRVLEIIDRKPSDGISVDEVEKICKEIKLSCLAIMSDGTLLKDIQTKRKEGGLLFVVANGHCYPISKKARRSFVKTHRNTTKWTVDKKKPEYEVCEYTDKSLSEVISESFEQYKPRTEEKEDSKEIEPTKIFIDTEEFSRSELIEIMEDQKIMFSIKSYNSKFNKIKIGQTLIKALPDRRAVTEFCSLYGKPFHDKTLSVLSTELFEEIHGKIPKSYLNDETRRIIYSIDPTAINVKFSETLENPYAIDIVRCYTASIKAYQFFPVFTNTDYPEPYERQKNKSLLVGKYYVKTNDNILFRGCGWYSHVIVEFGLKRDVIKYSDITHQLIAQYKYSSAKFKSFVDSVYARESSDELKKKIINLFIGSLGIKKESHEENFTTNSRDEALHYIAKNPTGATHYEYNGVHHIKIKKERLSTTSSCPIYQQVVEQGRIGAYVLYQQLMTTFEIVAIKTDCVIFNTNMINRNKLPELESHIIGGYRYDKKPTKATIRALPLYEKIKGLPSYVYKPWKWNTEKHNNPAFDIPEYKSFCLDGYAGTGKSWIINNKIPDTYERLAFSNSAANNIKGSTLHRFLKMKVGDESINSNTLKSLKNSSMVIDEYSMIPEELFNNILQLKINNPQINIIFAGDARQIQFIPRNSDNEYLEFNKPMPRLSDTYPFAKLCEFNKIVLNYCHRADVKFATDLIENKFTQHQGNFKTANVHITITNKKREKINLKMYTENKNKVLLTDDKFTYKKNTPWIAKLADKALNISKNEFFTLIAYEKKNKVLVLESEFKNKVCIKPREFKKLFDMRYAMTVNKLQGKTLTENYIIREWNHFHNDQYKKYTSCSRATHSGQYRISFN